MNVVLSMCAMGFLTGRMCSGATLRCYLRSPEQYLEVPLHEAASVLLSDCYEPSWPTLVYTHGYRGRARGPASLAILQAMTAGPRNVLMLVWEDEAGSGILGTNLGYMLRAAPNSRAIGRLFGDSLLDMSKAGFNLNTTHLIGFSLGAQVFAFTGLRVKEKGFLLPRITGLDPARILFEYPFTAYGAILDSTCAAFVDIVHTDAGGFGVRRGYGTVDFWPNYGSRGEKQPGCPEGEDELFTPEGLCSHDRSWMYFAESLVRPLAFPATAASDYEEWLLMSEQQRDLDTNYLGIAADLTSRGNYFLTTNPIPPFGKGDAGINEVDQSL